MGNGITNWKYDGIPALIEASYWHGLYGIDFYTELYKSGCKKEFEYFNFRAHDLSPKCEDIYTLFEKYSKNINQYNLYGKCWHDKYSFVS